jgi:hypothetical protein
MKSRNIKLLSLAFAMGGVWDTIAGLLYLFVIGSGRPINDPPVDPFYAVFLGSFFLCFAWLQIMSSFNIRRYAFNIGCLLFGRVFYIIVLYGFMLFAEGFPATFWFTGIIDGLLSILYLVLASRAGFSAKMIFLPSRDTTQPNPS